MHPATLVRLAPHVVKVRPRDKHAIEVGWPDKKLTPEEVETWSARGNLGLKGTSFPAIDIDIKHPKLEGLSQAVTELAREVCGDAPLRTRNGSTSRLLMYRPDEGLAYHRIGFVAPQCEGEWRIEFLAGRQQYVAHGIHPEGMPYQWDREVDPETAPVITKAKWEEFCTRARALLDLHGCTLVEDKAANITSRKALGCPEHLAPSPETVFAALRAKPNTPDNFPNRDRGTRALLPFMCAIKSALGDAADDYYEQVEEWALEYPGLAPDECHSMWRSIRDSAFGWSYIKEVVYGTQVQWDANPTPRGAFARIPYDDASGITEVQDFVEDMICEGTVVTVVGNSNVGKSFLVLDLAQHIALGWDWHGLEIDRGGVVYLAGEGQRGVSLRIAAFRQHYGWDKTAGAAFQMIGTTGKFRTDEDVTALITELNAAKEELGSLKLVVVDTLACAMDGGDENSSVDMGKTVASAKRVRDETGAAVLIVHHTGKDDTKGARGHSLLRAAVDGEFLVKRSSNTAPIELSTTKQRDMEYGKPMFFDLVSLELGANRRGKPIKSAVVVANTTACREEKPLLPALKLALDKLRELETEPGAAIVTATWRDAMDDVYKGMMIDKANTRQTKFRRALTDLERLGKIQIGPDTVAITDF